jgi:hypothetical protein
MRALAIAVAATLVLCAWGLGSSAEAAKEKFQRSKPHVNIGTIDPPKRSDEAPRLRQRDNAPASSLPTGKRQHKPIFVIKPVDK